MRYTNLFYIKINVIYNGLLRKGLQWKSFVGEFFFNETHKDCSVKPDPPFSAGCAQMIWTLQIFFDFEIFSIKNTVREVTDPIAQINIF